ncbi:MAG: metalloregulator ArsR/SmtB family transcription factor [Dermatophilaceae bacterium]
MSAPMTSEFAAPPAGAAASGVMTPAVERSVVAPAVERSVVAPLLQASAAEPYARVLKAMGDPARLRLTAMIAARDEVCVCELTPAFDLSSGTISHHLRTLREAGLIDGERRGTFVYYWIAPSARPVVDHLLSAPPRD